MSSDYEIKRLKNIKRNETKLKQLGLSKDNILISTGFSKTTVSIDVCLRELSFCVADNFNKI